MTVRARARDAELTNVMRPDEARASLSQDEALAKRAEAIILFGSRAAGLATATSDWDLLILLNEPVDDHREKALHRQLFDLELEAGEAISALVYARDEWHSEPRRSSSFYRNVHDEAIQL